MIKAEAIAAAVKFNERCVIMNIARKEAFLLNRQAFFEACIVDDYAFRFTGAVLGDTLNIDLNSKDWRVLKVGPLVEDFSPKNCLWNRKILSPIDVYSMLDDDTRLLVSNDKITWYKKHIAGVGKDSIFVHVDEGLEEFKYCRKIRKGEEYYEEVK